jgi:hypothetical protein
VQTVTQDETVRPVLVVLVEFCLGFGVDAVEVVEQIERSAVGLALFFCAALQTSMIALG